MCKLMIQHVKERNPRDREGVTPSQLAAENGHVEVLELFRNDSGNENKILK